MLGLNGLTAPVRYRRIRMTRSAGNSAAVVATGCMPRMAIDPDFVAKELITVAHVPCQAPFAGSLSVGCSYGLNPVNRLPGHTGAEAVLEAGSDSPRVKRPR
jgi:hypothetical protein